MNNTIHSAYCRLCGVLKPHNKLANLQNDEENCQQVVNKLSRFNIMLDFQDNILPKTVCSPCVKSLDRAFTFVTVVEQAQAFLNDFILVDVKPTVSYSCDENMLYQSSDGNIRVVDLKDEKSRESMEINDDDTNLSEKCHVETMTDACNDYFVTNGSISPSHVDTEYFGKTEEIEIEDSNDIKPSLDIIVENTVINDECVKPNLPEITSDLHHVEDDKNSIEAISEKEHNYSEQLQNTVCSLQNIHKQNNITNNICKIAPKTQPQPEKNKLLTTSIFSETTINKKQKMSKKYQQNNNKVTENTEINVEHIKLTWKDYEWKCSHCETIFPNLEELQSHSKQYHNACNLYQCTDCSCRRSKLNVFMNHVKNHRNYLAHSCYKCFKIFPKRNQATAHKRKVHDYFDYTCPGCNTPFNTNKELKAHIIKYYNKWTTIIPPHLTCGKCNKKCEDVKDFKRHLRTHKKQKEWFCETCGQKLTTRGSLKQHIEATHGIKKKLFQCDICNTSFRNIKGLQYHESVHTGIKPFTCDYCGKSFRYKGAIAAHMTFHRDLQPYSCTVCSRKFKYSDGLKRHMLQHTGEKPFSCHVCLRDFANLSNCQKHIRRRHGIEMVKKRRIAVKQQSAPDLNSPDLQMKLNSQNPDPDGSLES